MWPIWKKTRPGQLSFFESRWKDIMISVKLEWMPRSKGQFEKLRKRAIRAGKFAEFRLLHNEIVASLVDLQKATEVGERLNDTKRPGGEIRIWVHKHLSVRFVILRHERIAWILHYVAIPDTWLD
jgi:hypothetical protein